MAKFRTSGTALSKTFERSTSIIYLVDNQNRILYANLACSRWVGVPISELFGCQLEYSPAATLERSQHLLSGLCPPPDVWSEWDSNLQSDLQDHSEFYVWVTSERVIGSVATSDHSTNHSVDPPPVEYRRARAHRLTVEASDDELILVIAADESLPELPSDNWFKEQNRLASRQLHQALAEMQRQMKLTYAVDSLVGVSRFSAGLRRQVLAISQGPSDLMIEGENGSGKQHLARVIAAQIQKPHPERLISVDCRSLEFDSWKQSNADLEKIRRNLTQLKPAGFLPKVDKPTNLKLEKLQMLLLNVDQLIPEIQQQLFEFLVPEHDGFSRLPIQVVATACCDLLSLSDQDGFHAELARLLTSAKITLLPLRERLEDIPLLAQAMLERSAGEKPPIGFDRSVLALLGEYRWPGNLDQMRKVVQQANDHAAGALITSQHLPQTFQDALAAQRIGKFEEKTIDLTSLLEDIERELIVQALHQAQGNKAHAARLLSLSRNKLLRRLQYFEMDQQDRSQCIQADRAVVSAEDADHVADMIDPAAFEEID